MLSNRLFQNKHDGVHVVLKKMPQRSILVSFSPLKERVPSASGAVPANAANVCPSDPPKMFETLLVSDLRHSCFITILAIYIRP